MYKQLEQRFRLAIDDGRVRPGMRIPGELELARELKISPVTVSKALHALVRDGLVERRRKTGTFISDHATGARSVPSSPSAKTEAIWIVVEKLAHISHPNAGQIISGIEAVINDTEYPVRITCPWEARNGSSGSLLPISRDDSEIAGVIVLPQKMTALDCSKLAERFPTVVLQKGIKGVCGGVWVNYSHGFSRAVEHLHSLGHRKIGLLLGPRGDEFPTTREQEEGAFEMAAKCQIAISREHVMYGDYGHDTGYAMAIQLLSEKDRPTAILCADDDMAVGAIQAAESLGLYLPRDLSVVGCNDMPVATVIRPRLTTLAVSGRQLGRRLAEMLLRLISEQISPVETALEPRLVVRESTGPIPSRSP